MTADLIQAKYDVLDSVASKFNQHAEDTTQLESKVRQHFQALEQGGWQGRGVTAFIAEMNGNLFPAMQRMSHVLGEASAVTLQVKDIVQKAEEEAAALFGKGAGTSDSGGQPTAVGGESGGASHSGEDGKHEPSKFLKGLGEAFGIANHFLDLAGHLPSWGIGTAFSFLGDEASGKGWLHDLLTAGGSNAVKEILSSETVNLASKTLVHEGLEKIGIKIGERFIPGVGEVLLANDAVQLAGHVLGIPGLEKIDLNRPIDWAVGQEVSRIQSGGVKGLMERMNPATAPLMAVNDAVQIVGDKVLHLHGIGKIDLQRFL